MTLALVLGYSLRARRAPERAEMLHMERRGARREIVTACLSVCWIMVCGELGGHLADGSKNFLDQIVDVENYASYDPATLAGCAALG